MTPSEKQETHIRYYYERFNREDLLLYIENLEGLIAGRLELGGCGVCHFLSTNDPNRGPGDYPGRQAVYDSTCEFLNRWSKDNLEEDESLGEWGVMTTRRKIFVKDLIIHLSKLAEIR